MCAPAAPDATPPALSILFTVAAGWLALCVPASIALLALGRAADAGDAQPAPLPVWPEGSVVPFPGRRASVCSGCAVVVVSDDEHPHCPRCDGETAFAPGVGARHAAAV